MATLNLGYVDVLLGLSTTGILEVHERVAQLGHRQVALTDTLAVLQALREIGPGASSLDVARLAEEGVLTTRVDHAVPAERFAEAYQAAGRIVVTF